MGAEGPMRLAIVVLLTAVVAARAGITSVWLPAPVSVDGVPGEWSKLEPLERGPAVGAFNDGEFLYLLVTAREPESIGHLAAGLIVWVESYRTPRADVWPQARRRRAAGAARDDARAGGDGQGVCDGARSLRRPGPRTKPETTRGSHARTRHRAGFEPRGERSRLRAEDSVGESRGREPTRWVRRPAAR